MRPHHRLGRRRDGRGERDAGKLGRSRVLESGEVARDEVGKLDLQQRAVEVEQDAAHASAPRSWVTVHHRSTSPGTFADTPLGGPRRLKCGSRHTDNEGMSTSTKDLIIPKLKAIPLFADLSTEDLDALSSLVNYKTLPKGAFVINQNEQGATLYLLVSGRVKVSLPSPDGRELALNYLDAPSHFGEMSLVDSEPRSADVIASTDLELLTLDAKDLSKAIQLQPRLALSLIATLSRRLRQTISRLQDLAFHDATHRVIRVLLNIATAAYETRGVPVIVGFTHYEIATVAGTSRETASRVISQLAKEEVLATRGRRIVVDLVKLRDRLDSE